MTGTISPAEAATELGVSRSVVYRLVHDKQLAGHRAGGSIRIDRASVEYYRRTHSFGPVRRHRAKPAAVYQCQIADL